MPEDLVLRHCSPTLAGIKTGSLFSYAFESREEVFLSISMLNGMLVPKGLSVIPLKIGEKRALIYLFRPQRLKQDLCDLKASEILANFGYVPENWASCVSLLCKKFESSSEFPHEIGLFLGYPPEDVAGFIENKSLNCKYVGYWKVYGDEKKAKKLFAKYHKCTEIYCSQWQAGKSIERLVVAD